MKFKREIMAVILVMCMLFTITAISAADSSEDAVGVANASVETVNMANDDSLGMENDGEILGDGESSQVGNYAQLKNNITNADENSVLYLYSNYKFTDSVETNGITISKNLIIDGQGHTIDANGKCRVFYTPTTGKNIVFKNIKFINGNAFNGGAISTYAYKTTSNKVASIEIINCTFVNNTAKYGTAYSTYGNGGALFIVATNHVYIINSTFVDNNASENSGKYGGAAYITTSSATNGCKIINSTFINNYANTNGGVLYIYGKSGVDQLVDGCTFINNTGSNSVSRIYSSVFYGANNGNFIVNNSIFINNSKNAVNIGPMTYSLDNNWWGNTENNFDTSLYSIYSKSANSWLFLKLETDDSTGTATISLNNLYSSETGVEDNYVGNIPQIKFNIKTTNVHVDENIIQLDNEGKATFNYQLIGSTGTITVSYENIEITKDIKDLSFTGLKNTIELSEDSTIYLNDDYAYDSGKDSGLTDGIDFAKSVTIDGQGHIIDAKNQKRIFNFNDETKDLVLKNIRFANANAGAIYVIAKSLTLINCTFIDNSATSSGGAIYLQDSEDSEIINCTFISNSATNYGSAIVINSKNTEKIEGCNFTDNIGSSVIYCMDEGTYNIHNSIFINNQGLAVDGENTATINADYNWWGNTADNYATIMVNVGSSVTRENWLFLNMAADDKKGLAEISLNNLYTVGVGNSTYLGYALPEITLNISSSNVKVNKNNVTIDKTGKSSLNYVVKTTGSVTARYNDDIGITKDVTYDDDRNFKSLYNLITNIAEEGETIELKWDYNYDSSTDSQLVNQMLIRKTLVIDGKGHTIDAKGQTHIFRVNEVKVTFKNITFINGHSSNGGALYCYAYYNDCYSEIINCTFINNVASNVGGAIYNYYNLKNVVNCTFINNSAPSDKGGAIYTQGYAIDVSNSILVGNAAGNIIDGSGSVTANNNWWGHTVDNYETPISIGSKVTASNWYVLNMSVDSSTNAELALNNLYDGNGISIDSNYALPAITFNTKSSNTQLSSSNVTLNKLGNGDIEHSFSKKYSITASYNGVEITRSFVYWASFNELKSQINDATEELILDQSYAFNPNVDNPNDIIFSKSLTIDGAGFTIDAKGLSNIFYFNDDTNTKTLILKNIIFANADGENGAAVYFNGNRIEIINCTFINNTATSKGAAIYVNGANSNVENKISKCIFVNNTCEGSVIYLNSAFSDAIFEVCDSVFVNNNGINIAKGTCNVNADYNWWGNNASNYDVNIANVGEGINIEKWFYLNMTVNDEISKAEISLNNLNDGSGHDYALPELIFDISTVNAIPNKDNIILDLEGKATVDYSLTGLSGLLTTNFNSVGIANKIKFFDKGDFDSLQSILDFVPEGYMYKLTRNYTYSESDVVTNGILIDKFICIDGNGSTIDAKGKSRIFNVNSDNVYLKNINFINGIADTGGAIFTSSNYLNVENCTFINNTATNTDGGAIYSTSKYFGSVVKSTFINNSAIEDGGAICTFSESTLADIDGCIFVNNTALYSSVIYAYKCDVENSIFLNNPGNMIRGYYSSSHVIKYDWFGNTFDNRADSPNLESSISNWLYLDIKFYEDVAVVLLNKIYSSSDSLSVYSNYNLPEITLNISSTSLDLYGIKNITLDSNGEARVSYAKLSDDATLTVSYNDISLTKEWMIGEFDSLQALIDSHSENSLIELTQDYSYNEADEIIEGIIINKNITIDGNGSTIDAKEMTRIFNVQALNVTFKNIVFANGKSNLDITSGKSNNGGAIYYNLDNTQPIEFNVDNCTFVNNTANNILSNMYLGGAIFINSNEGEFNIKNSAFINNTATSDAGGAIYFNTKDSKFNLYNSSFIGNKATNYAVNGALYIKTDNGETTIDKCLFKESSISTASWSSVGSAIILDSTNENGNNVVKNSIFIDNNGNSAKNNKFAFLLKSGTVTIDDNWWGTTTNNNIAWDSDYTQGVAPTTWLFINSTVGKNKLQYNETTTITYSLQSFDGTNVVDFDNSKLPEVEFDVEYSSGELSSDVVSLNEDFTFRMTDTGSTRLTIYCNGNIYETWIYGPYIAPKVDVPYIMYANQYKNKNLLIKTASGIYSGITVSCNSSLINPNTDVGIRAGTTEGTAKLIFTYDGSLTNYPDPETYELVVKVFKVPLTINVTNIEGNEITLNVTDTMDLDIEGIVDKIHTDVSTGDVVIDYKFNNSVISFTHDYFKKTDDPSYYATGHITAVGGGTTNLTICLATLNTDKFACENYTIKITVNKIPTEVDFDDNDSFKVDDEDNINAIFKNNGTQQTATLIYESSDEDVVKFTSNTGDFKAMGNGTATLTVKFDGNSTHEASSKSITVTVTKYTTQITVTSNKNLELKVNDKSQIVATLTAEDNADLGSPTYSSSDENVVTVDSNGLITAVGGGEANITVSYAGNYRYDAAEDVNVSVKVNKLPTIITVNPATDVDVDASKSLGATVDNGRTLHYESLNPGIVSVDDSGVITGIIGGTGVINVSFVEDAQYMANSTTVTVTVNKINPSITVDPIEINVFESKLISPTIVSDGVISYVSCDPAIVTVNATTGNITGVKGGKANVTVRVAEGAKYLAKDVNVTVTVKKLPTTIEVTTAISVDVDGTNTIVAYADHGRALEFVSLDETIVTVDSTTGVIRGVIGGKANVTVKFHEDDQYLANEVNVTVTVNKLTPTIEVGSISIDVFESKFINPDIENGGTVTYESCNSSIVTVDESTGKITGVIGGKVNVTIKVAETPRNVAKDVNVTVTVNKLPTIIAVGSTMTLKLGDSNTIVASVITGADIHYLTGSDLITVNETTGLVRAIKGGIAEVTVSADETDKYKANSTVVSVTVTRLPDDDTPITLSVFSQADVSTLYDFGDTNNLEYNSSNKTVFTVSDAGILEAITGGEANLTIKDERNGQNVTIKVIVNKLATPMDVTPSITINVYQDEVIDINIPDRANINQLHYESSNPNVVTVDENGKITGVTGGTATITITYAEDGQFLENSTEVQVTVKKLSTAININETEFTLYVDGIGIINATTNNESGLYYASTSPSVMLADNIVTGVSEGVAEIKVIALENEKYLANSAIVTVNVKKIPSTITAKTTEFSIDVDDNVTIEVLLNHEGTLTYKYNESIVNVENGVIFALIGGKTNITISYAGDDKYAAAEDVNVSVTVNKIAKVINVDSAIEVYVDRHNTIVADADGRTLEFISLDETIVTVDPSTGEITGVKGGNANVTVKCRENDKYFANEANITVTVNKLPVTIRVNSTLQIDYGKSDIIRIPYDGYALEYISLNPEIVTVDKDTGSITAVKAGVANVTVKCREDDKYLGEVNVTVTVIGLPITLVIEEANDAIVGGSSTIKVSLRNSTDSSLITDASGFVMVNVNGTDYPINILETDHVDAVLDKVGLYDIIAIYQGDDKYRTVESNPETVKGLPKYENAINVAVTPNIKTADKVEINATSSSGAIEIYVDGENQTVSDGKVIIDSLSVGEHTIKVKSPETAQYVANSTELTINVGKKQSEINISVEEDLIVDSIIKINIENTGSDIVVYLDGEVLDDYKEPFKATSGNHLIVATVSEDENYLGCSESYNFTVSKKSSQIYVAGTSVTVGEATTIEVMDLPSDATGIVIIDLNGTKYSINITESKTLDVVLEKPGIYDVSALYLGDEKYLSKESEVNTILAEDKKTTIIDEIDLPDTIAVADTLTVDISSNNDKLEVLFDGVKKEIVGGKLTIENITAGNHKIDVIALETNEFKANSTSKSFDVAKKEAKINIDMPEYITLGQDIEINVSSYDGADIAVYVDGEKQTLEDGKLTVKATVGSHTVIATVDETDKYLSDMSNKTFAVDKFEPQMSVSGLNITEGQKTTITIDTPLDEGIVNVKVGDVEELVDLSKSKTVEIQLDTPKDYEITASFLGNDNYKAVESKTIINVAKKETPDVNIGNLGDANQTKINVSLPSDAAGSLTVTVDGDKNYTASVVNGSASVNIPDLSAGNHSITVSYSGDEKYGPINKTTVVDVPKSSIPENSTEISMEIPEGTTSPVVDVTLPSDATGNLTVTVDGDKNYTADVVNGTASISVDELSVGTHNVTVAYSGDDKYEPVAKNTTVDVPKVAIPENATDVEINVPEGTNSPVVNVTLPVDSTGTVTVTVDGDKNYTADVVNGTASISVDELNSGTHNVTVAYSGDDKYKQVVKDTTVDVPKIEVPENSTEINMTVPEGNNSPNVNVTLPKDASGTVSVIVDGNKTYTADVSNGTASVNVPELSVGNHEIIVSYSGDNKYDSITKSTTINVPKVNIPQKDARIDIDLPIATKSPTLNITLPSDATGYIVVNNSGVCLYQPVNNGNASINLGSLAYGEYNVTVTYSGDDKYNPVVKNTTVNVLKPQLAAKNVVCRYSNVFKYKIRVTVDGEPVVGKYVRFTFNGKTYKRFTDENGYATLKVNTNKFKVGTYKIITKFSDVSVTKKFKISNVIMAKNLNVKKSGALKVKVQLKKVKGKYLKGKTLKIKLNGKTYKAKTNKKGVAIFKISKNALAKLKVGKTYKYKVSYGKDVVTKKIKIKR